MSTIEHARQILQLADPCGRLAGDIDEYVGIVNGILEGLIAEEREACALECDIVAVRADDGPNTLADTCAARIRARGKVST